MYTDKQEREIEKVISVFNEYIHATEHIDLVRSEKLGYILIYFNPQTLSMEMDPAFIADGCELCKLILTEIAEEVLDMTNNEHDIAQADPLEKAEIKKRIEPFAEQLPEYRHLFDGILCQPLQGVSI